MVLGARKNVEELWGMENISARMPVDKLSPGFFIQGVNNLDIHSKFVRGSMILRRRIIKSMLTSGE